MAIILQEALDDLNRKRELDQLFGKESIQSKAIQDYKWSQLSEDDKDYYQVLYAEPKTREVIKECLIKNFGEHNLQSQTKIRTWEDIEEEIPQYKEDREALWRSIYTFANNDELALKLNATYKISKLIELGYGGLVTNEEWEETDIEIWFVRTDPEGKLIIDSSYAAWHHFIAFHTQQQAKEFMSYPENRALVEHYYIK